MLAELKAQESESENSSNYPFFCPHAEILLFFPFI